MAVHFALVDPIDDDESPFVFPEYATLMKNQESDRQVKNRATSRVSNRFNKQLLTVGKLLNKYDTVVHELDPLEEKMTSHAMKKFLVNHMNSTPGLKGTSVIFRSGWEFRNVHTLFDYLVSDPFNDACAARSLSGWAVGPNNEAVGGRPPTLSCLTIETQKQFKAFTEVLFRPVQKHILGSILDILTANLLRFWSLYTERIHTDPLKRHNLFFTKVRETYQRVGISDEMFSEACDTVRKDFTRRNFEYIPMEQIQNEFPSYSVETNINPRTLMSTMENIAQKISHVAMEVEDLKTQHRNDFQKVLTLVTDIQRQIRKTNSVPAPISAPVDASATSIVDLDPHYGFLPSSCKGVQAVDAYFKWFQHDIESIYARYMRDDNLTDTKKQRTKIKSAVSDIRTTVRLMLLFSNTHTKTYVSQDPFDIAHYNRWLESVKHEASLAILSTCQFLADQLGDLFTYQKNHAEILVSELCCYRRLLKVENYQNIQVSESFVDLRDEFISVAKATAARNRKKRSAD